MIKHPYTYGSQQEGHFIPRARVTFQPFNGCFIIYESKYGWSNYFGCSNLYRKIGQGDKIVETLESFTKSWFVGLDHEDWPILKEISDRPIPEGTKRDEFYQQRDKDIEAYITSKLGWQ